MSDCDCSAVQRLDRCAHVTDDISHRPRHPVSVIGQARRPVSTHITNTSNLTVSTCPRAAYSPHTRAHARNPMAGARRHGWLPTTDARVNRIGQVFGGSRDLDFIPDVHCVSQSAQCVMMDNVKHEMKYRKDSERRRAELIQTLSFCLNLNSSYEIVFKSLKWPMKPIHACSLVIDQTLFLLQKLSLHIS